MVKIYKCDVPDCNEEAHKLDIDVCSGYYTSNKSPNCQKIKYEPFERPTIEKRDLCKEHFKLWCKATYLFYKRGVDNE